MAEGGSDIIPIGVALDTSGLQAGLQQATSQLQQLAVAATTLQQSFTSAQTSAFQLSSTLQGLQAAALSTTTNVQALGASTAQAQAGMQTMIGSMAQAQTAFSQLTQQAQQLTTQLANQHATVQQHAQGVTASSASLTSWSSLVRGAELALAAFGVALSARGLLEFGKSVIETGMTFERLQVSMVTLTGSQRSGAEAFNLVKQQADTLGYSIETLGEGYRKLLGATRLSILPQEDVARLFVQITNAMKTVGATEPEVSGALRMLEQAFARGFITQRQLHQGLNAIPGAMDLFIKSLGVSREELNRMGTDTELISAIILPKFGDTLEKQLSGRLPAALQTGETALGRFKNAWKEMENAVAESGVLAAVAKRLENLTSLVQTASGTRPGQYPAIEQAQKESQVPGLTHTPEADELRKAQDYLEGAVGNRRRTEAITYLTPEDKELRVNSAWDLQLAALKRYEEALEAFHRRAFLQPVTPASAAGMEGEGALFGATPGQLSGDARGRENEKARLARQAEIAQLALNEKLDAYNKLLENAQKRIQAMPDAAPKIWEETIRDGEKLLKVINDIKIQAGDTGKSLTIPGGAPGVVPLASPSADIRGLPSVPMEQRQAIMAQVQTMAPQYGLDPRLVQAIIERESGFNPQAQSPAGARGLMQLMPKTVKDPGVTDATDITRNLQGGMSLLRELMQQYHNDMARVLAAYNAGPKRLAEAEGGGRALPRETQAYVPAITARYKQLGGGQGGGPAGADFTAGMEAQRAKLTELEAQRKDFATFKEDIKTLQQLEDQLVKVTAGEQAAATATVVLRDARSREKAGLERTYLQNPQAGRDQVQTAISSQREMLDTAQATEKEIRQLDQLSQRMQTAALSTMGHTAAEEQLHTARAQALLDDERLSQRDRERITSMLEVIRLSREQMEVMQAAHQQQALDDARQQRVTQQADQYRDQIERATLTPSEQLQRQMERQGIDPDSGQGRLLQSRQQDAQNTRYASQLSNQISKDFENLILHPSKDSLQKLAENFQKTFLDILIDASGWREQLTSLLRDLLKGIMNGAGSSGGSSAGSAAASWATSLFSSSGGAGASVSDSSAAGVSGEGALFAAAEGGDLWANQMALVGEEGPELFVPRSAGTIIPNNQLGGMRGYGSAVVNVHVHGVTDAQSFVKSGGEVRQAMYRAFQDMHRDA